MPETSVISDAKHVKQKNTLIERVASPFSKTITRFKRGDQSAHDTLQDFREDVDLIQNIQEPTQDLISVIGEGALISQERYSRAVALVETHDTPDSDYLTIKKTVDGYSRNQEPNKERVFTSADKIRHKALEAFAVTQGVKNKSEFNALVRKLEGSMIKTEYKHLDFDHVLTPEEQQRVKDEWREKGYSVSDYDFRPPYDEDGKVKYTASFTKQVPLNVQRSDIGVVKQLLESGENSAGALASLEKIGIKVTNLKFDQEELAILKKLINVSGSHESMTFLDLYSKLPISNYLNISKHGSPYDADSILALLQNDTKKYTPDFMEKVRVISTFAQTHINPFSLMQYEEIFNSEEKFTFLTTGLAHGYIKPGYVDLGKVVSLDSDSTSKLNILMKSNVKLIQDYYSYDKSVLNMSPAALGELLNTQDIKSVLESPEKQQFSKILGEIAKIKVDAGSSNSMFENRVDIVSAYCIFLRSGILHQSDWEPGKKEALGDVARFLENEKVKSAIEDPNFPSFLDQLKKEGINIKPMHRVYVGNYDIFEVYRYRDLIKLAGEDIIDYAGAAAEGDVADSAMRGKLNEYGRVWLTLEKEQESFKKKYPNIAYDNSLLLEYAEKFYKPDISKNPVLKEGQKIFGDYFSFGSYVLTKGILDGSIDPEIMHEMGITKTGNEGLAQLRSAMQNFTLTLVSNEFNSDLLKNSVFSDFFKSYVRFETASFGLHDSESFSKTVSSYERIKNEKPEILNTDLPPSGVVEIARMERSSQSEVLTETFLSRYATLSRNIQAALDISSQPRAFSTMAKMVDEKRLEVIKRLTQDYEANENPKAKEHIKKRIDSLTSINPSDVKSFQSNFAELSQEKAFSDLLMQSVFLYTLKKHPEQVDRMTAALSDGPNVDSVTAVLDFTEHMTTKEAWKDYFTDKKARKGFQNILDTKEINDGLSRLLAVGTKSKDVSLIEFVPTRGLMMEFSGYLADACWASRYDNTAEQFPNMSAVIMQDISKEIPKPIGSSILIETTSPDGVPLLIIRGLNPLESYINHVDVADFYRKYTDYVKRIAEVTGRKAAIVIDSHSGGSATNRPLLFKHLEEQKQGLTQIPVSYEGTTFNNYDISKSTYLL